MLRQFFDYLNINVYIYLKPIKGMIMSTYTTRTTSQQVRQLQIQSVLKNNQYTFVQMNANEFMGFMFNVQKLNGKSQTETIEWVDTIFGIKSKDDVVPHVSTLEQPAVDITETTKFFTTHDRPINFLNQC